MKSVLAPVLAAAIALGSLLSAPASAAAPDDSIRPAPCQLVSVDTAKVVPNSRTGDLILVVTGTKSATNVVIEFMPLDYFQQPDYWEIEVLGCPVGVGLQVITPYTEKFNVTGNVGTAGILVKGADNSIKIDLRVAPK